MAGLNTPEALFLGTVLEGIFYGVFCVIFALYLNIQNKGPTGHRFLYPMTAMFMLCTCFIFFDFTQQFLTLFRPTAPNTAAVTWKLNVLTSVIYSVVDAISQSVLIYRCWIMWDRKPYIVIAPSILTFCSFVTSIALVGEEVVLNQQVQIIPNWFLRLGVASFSVSLSVNTIVSGLIILKLAFLQREVTSTMPKSGSASKIRPLISMFMESGLLMFFSQLTWVVLFKLQNVGFNSIGGTVTMIYGITPTVVLVRVAMGRSYEARATTVLHSAMTFARSTNHYGITTAQEAGVDDKSQGTGNSTRVNESAVALGKFF